MKIKLSTFKNTNIGFPSEWTCKTESGDDVLISYRYGRIKFFVNGEKVDMEPEPEKDPFDVGGAMHCEEMVSILHRFELLSDETEEASEDTTGQSDE